MVEVLIIGGGGFIGSAVVREFEKYEPIVLDKFTYAGRLENLKKVRCTIIRGDIRDKEFLERIVYEYKPEIVINLAAETHVDRSIVNPYPFLYTNTLGTLNILELAKKYRFKYVHISTDEVYGEQEAKENMFLLPNNPYSASKAAADLFIRAYIRTYKIDAIIIRPCNNYGPRQHPEKLVPKAIIRTLLNLPVPIHGDGKQIRDWMFVEDTARLIKLLALSENYNRVYNLPAHQYASVLEIIKMLNNILKKKTGKEIKIKFVKDRPGGDKFYKMHTDLKYEVTPLEEGLEKTVQWYLDNKWWWESLTDDEFFIRDEPW